MAMKKRQSSYRALLCGALLLLAGAAQAQPWAGILSPGRAVDWSNAGVQGGIPSRPTVCATLNPGATAAQINSAIAGCASGQVVFLSAGTYNLSGGITFNNKANVTLRGAGADRTRLVITGSAGCHGVGASVCMDSRDTHAPVQTSNTANITGGPWAKGTNQLTLSNVSNLAVGKPVSIDQLNDSSDNGTIYICETVAGRCNDDGPSGGSSGGQRDDRGQAQMVTITAINGNTITFSPGLYMPNWRPSQSPQAFWSTSPLMGAGLEDLSLDNTRSSGQYGVMLLNCQNCWVKGIRSINPDRAHVVAYNSNRVTVRDSYFYGTRDAVSQSYGFECFPGSDVLIENNIFQHITGPQVINANCSGSVIGYNYSIDNYYVQSPGFMQHAATLHAGGIDNILVEGNVGQGMRGDLFHGTHHFVTAFRNYYAGWETGKTSSTVPIFLNAYSRYFNIVGNVLGRSGYHSRYETNTSGGNADSSIYAFGLTTRSTPDPKVAETVMRWGNWDVVNNAGRFVASEVPSGLSLYANAVPASQTLPASFYMPGKPSWFGNVPWPAIGPDVSNGNNPGVGGKAYKIPAQLCFEGAAKEGELIVFNAATCYGGGGGSSAPAPLAPPSGLSASVQ